MEKLLLHLHYFEYPETILFSYLKWFFFVKNRHDLNLNIRLTGPLAHNNKTISVAFNLTWNDPSSTRVIPYLLSIICLFLECLAYQLILRRVLFSVHMPRWCRLCNVEVSGRCYFQYICHACVVSAVWRYDQIIDVFISAVSETPTSVIRD